MAVLDENIPVFHYFEQLTQIPHGSYNEKELANYLAVDRASLSRSLGELKNEGIIDFKKNQFTILSTAHFKYE